MLAHVQDVCNVREGVAAAGCLQKIVKMCAKVRLWELQKKVQQPHLHAH
jgi:hypothetical protein